MVQQKGGVFILPQQLNVLTADKLIRKFNCYTILSKNIIGLFFNGRLEGGRLWVSSLVFRWH